MNYGYNAPCVPSLSGYGLGATAAQKAASAAAAFKAAQAKRAAAATKKTVVKVAGKTVATAHPQAAAVLNQSVASAQSQLNTVMKLAAVAKKTRSKVDIQRALVAANTAGKNLQALIPASAKSRLKGLYGLDDCIPDGSGTNYFDTLTGQPCQPPQYGQTYPPVDATGLTPGFGLPTMPLGLPTAGYGQGYPPVGGGYGSGFGDGRPCASYKLDSNRTMCAMQSISQGEQQQFQYVFSIMQQMYAQLLTIIQQLMAQLQSAQQSPYNQPQSPYPSPYTDPYSQYGGAYGQPGYGSPYGAPMPTYGGQYPGPGMYAPYSGGGDSSVIPAGYDGGGDSFESGGLPQGDISQIFPGPRQGSMPMSPSPQSAPNIISSDSLPDGAGSQDMFGGDAPVPAFQQATSSPIPAPTPQSSAVSPMASPIIQQPQGPGQSPYADAGLPVGSNQLEPSSTESWN